MTALVWTPGADPRYESGIDRGVLFLPDEDGISWNGLVSVEHSFDGGKAESYYLDGVRYTTTVSPKTFKASLQSFGVPESFGPCLGHEELAPGVILTAQPRKSFSLAYRTRVGATGYKIHILYNAYAALQNRVFPTLSSSVTPAFYTMALTATPEDSSTFRPTAHVIVDSTKVDSESLLAFESVLYGTMASPPTLPTQDELNDLFAV